MICGQSRMLMYVHLSIVADSASSLLTGAGTADGSDKMGEARRAHLAQTGSSAPVLPFGVTLLGGAWTDEYLWGVAEQFCRITGLKCGTAGHGLA